MTATASLNQMIQKKIKIKRTNMFTIIPKKEFKCRLFLIAVVKTVSIQTLFSSRETYLRQSESKRIGEK